jgi:hypothetical protein
VVAVVVVEELDCQILVAVQVVLDIIPHLLLVEQAEQELTVLLVQVVLVLVWVFVVVVL